MAQYGLGQNSPIDDVFSDSVPEVSSFSSFNERMSEKSQSTSSKFRNNLSDDISEVPVSQARSFIFEAENNMIGLISEIDRNLKQVLLDPYSNMELEKSHLAVWKDAVKKVEEAKTKQIPTFVCYEEYQYAEKHKCRSCRAFTKDYELTISQSTFGHLLEVRKVLKYLLNELMIIKNISTYYLGEEYRDETEAQITRYFTDWAKSASHYTKQFAKEITTAPVSIPSTEVDKISKKQAAQFQAFFSVKINSLTTEIHTLTNLVKRDSVDTAETFYNNYLMPALNIKSRVIDPVMFDIQTTNLNKEIPTLFKEMITANSAVIGNLGAVTADFLERNNQIYKRFDALLQAIRLKRRYVNYLVQLESKGIKRKNPLIVDSSLNVVEYSDIFDDIPIDSSKRESLRSSHNDLDDIDGDAHPQYLRKDGGIITGDISIADGVKIAGLDLANHTHNFEDGSAPISALSIDYQTARSEYANLDLDKPYSNLLLKSVNMSILNGGVPIYEAAFEIEIDNDKIDSYEFEILYKEI